MKKYTILIQAVQADTMYKVMYEVEAETAEQAEEMALGYFEGYEPILEDWIDLSNESEVR